MMKQPITFGYYLRKDGSACPNRGCGSETPMGPDPWVPAGLMSLPVAEVAQDQAGNVKSFKERNNFHLKMTT